MYKITLVLNHCLEGETGSVKTTDFKRGNLLVKVMHTPGVGPVLQRALVDSPVSPRETELQKPLEGFLHSKQNLRVLGAQARTFGECNGVTVIEIVVGMVAAAAPCHYGVIAPRLLSEAWMCFIQRILVQPGEVEFNICTCVSYH